MKTLRNIAAALAFAALFTFLGVALIGCGEPGPYPCGTWIIDKGKAIFQALDSPGGRVESDELQWANTLKARHPECFQ